MTTTLDTTDLIAEHLYRAITDDETAYNVAAAITRDPQLSISRRVVISGEWRDVKDALEALPEGTRIDLAHGNLGVKRRDVVGRMIWHTTRTAGYETSESIARDNTPIEVLA